MYTCALNQGRCGLEGMRHVHMHFEPGTRAVLWGMRHVSSVTKSIKKHLVDANCGSNSCADLHSVGGVVVVVYLRYTSALMVRMCCWGWHMCNCNGRKNLFFGFLTFLLDSEAAKVRRASRPPYRSRALAHLTRDIAVLEACGADGVLQRCCFDGHEMETVVF